jgi:hypothetical protein
MRDDRPDVQFDGNASGLGTFGEARGVIAEHLIRTPVNEKQWETGEISVERRRERIAGIGVAKVIARGESDARAVEHGAAVGGGSNGVAGSGKIGPGRKQRCGYRERDACGAKSEHERECETTASGLTREDDPLRWIARA